MDREAAADALQELCPRDEDGRYRAGWLAAADALRQLQLELPKYCTLADLGRLFELSPSTPATWLLRFPGHCKEHDAPTEGCGWCMIEVQRQPPTPDAAYGSSEAPLWLVSRVPSWRAWRQAWANPCRRMPRQPPGIDPALENLS